MNNVKEFNFKGKCSKEIVDLLFCINQKYECYDRIKKLDLCLEKNKLEDYKKSLKVPDQKQFTH